MVSGLYFFLAVLGLRLRLLRPSYFGWFAGTESLRLLRLLMIHSRSRVGRNQRSTSRFHGTSDAFLAGQCGGLVLNWRSGFHASSATRAGHQRRLSVHVAPRQDELMQNSDLHHSRNPSRSSFDCVQWIETRSVFPSTLCGVLAWGTGSDSVGLASARACPARTHE